MGEDVNIEEFVMSKDELTGADIKVRCALLLSSSLPLRFHPALLPCLRMCLSVCMSVCVGDLH